MFVPSVATPWSVALVVDDSTSFSVQWYAIGWESSVAEAVKRKSAVATTPLVPSRARSAGGSVSTVQVHQFVVETLPAASVAYTLTSYSPSDSTAPVNASPSGRPARTAAVSAPFAPNAQWKVSVDASVAVAEKLKFTSFVTDPFSGLPLIASPDGAVASSIQLTVVGALSLPASSTATTLTE